MKLKLITLTAFVFNRAVSKYGGWAYFIPGKGLGPTCTCVLIIALKKLKSKGLILLFLVSMQIKSVMVHAQRL